MPTRRSFFASVAALIPALGVPVAARPKVIRLRDIGHGYDPTVGALGRGKPVTREELAQIDTTGYQPFVLPGHSTARDFPVYGADGLPDGNLWRGFVRADGGCYVAAVEFEANESERRALLDAPVWCYSNPYLTFRSHLLKNGINPEAWACGGIQ